MIKWMTDNNNSDLTSSGTFGNYADTTPTINLGRTAFVFLNGSYWYIDPFVETWIADTSKAQGVVNKTGYLWTTGASNEARKKNLYDVAGNVWEWTEETSFFEGNSSEQCRVFRSSASLDLSYNYPVCYRAGTVPASKTYITGGFRVVLYMR